MRVESHSIHQSSLRICFIELEIQYVQTLVAKVATDTGKLTETLEYKSDQHSISHQATCNRTPLTKRGRGTLHHYTLITGFLPIYYLLS